MVAAEAAPTNSGLFEVRFRSKRITLRFEQYFENAIHPGCEGDAQQVTSLLVSVVTDLGCSDKHADKAIGGPFLVAGYLPIT